MKRSNIDGPEPFSLSPLLAILPISGNSAKLHDLGASLFARLEKVSAMRTEEGLANERDVHRRLVAEEGMLKTLLDWLSQRDRGTQGSATGKQVLRATISSDEDTTGED